MRTQILLIVALLVLATSALQSQNAGVRIYNPEANAKAEISAAVKKAAAENKHVLLQVGGNWCPWCIRLHNVFNTDTKIDSALKANYVFVLVNYSKENKNLPLLKEFEFPQRFGFPVLLVLNKDGKRIHTQATDLLEMGEGYDNKKILSFLNAWSVKALDPANYPEK